MGVAGTEQHERGKHTGEAAITILKRMDGEEDDDEAADKQQRMQGALAVSLDEPGDERLHLARGIEGRGGLEDDADLFAFGIECRDVIR